MNVNDQENLNVDRYQHGPNLNKEASIDHFDKSFYDLDIKQACSRSNQHSLYLDLELGNRCGYVDMHSNVKNVEDHDLDET
jgi:hypothetical protein